MRDTEKEAEGEADSMQGARCGTRSWDHGIIPWAKGRCSTLEPPRCPWLSLFLLVYFVWLKFQSLGSMLDQLPLLFVDMKGQRWLGSGPCLWSGHTIGGKMRSILFYLGGYYLKSESEEDVLGLRLSLTWECGEAGPRWSKDMEVTSAGRAD